MGDASTPTEPVRSMTGAGTFVLEAEVGRIEAEARSVNHRFLKTTVRTQGPLPSASQLVEDALKKVVRRGHVTVHLRYRPAPAASASAWIDDAAFAQAAQHLSALAAQSGLGSVQPGDVLRVPGVLVEGRASQEEDALTQAVGEAVAGAANALQSAREREGALLTREVLDLLDQIAGAVAGIVARAGEVPLAWREKLQRRLQDLLAGSGVEPDPAHLARECALYAEKSDVREEIARLQAHVVHAREVLAAGGPVGRRLDFLVQELHREANTIGSKTSDLDLSRTVLDLRTAIERLREQVQNLE